MKTHDCSPNLQGKESLTLLAAEAAKKALEMAQVDVDDVDLILMCTSTPDDLFGGAPQVQKALGCKSNPLSHDNTAACSGFVLGLVSASCHIRGGGFKHVLVIGADALSRFVDWSDRGTCILFGYVTGAVLVHASDIEEDFLLGFDVHSDGDGSSNFCQRYTNVNGHEWNEDFKLTVKDPDSQFIQFNVFDWDQIIKRTHRPYWNEEFQGVPEQKRDSTCGYFVIRYMREIVKSTNIMEFATKWADKRHGRAGLFTYTKAEIDEVRNEWAQHVDTFPEVARRHT